MTADQLKKFDAFAKKYDGKPLDFDKRYGYQCVDLVRGYFEEVLGLPGYTLPGVKYAKELYKNFKTHPHFDRIANTPINIPQKGDIIVWDFYPFVTGWAGHVSIFWEGNILTFVSFDQNYPTGTLCHFQKHGKSKNLHGYRGVMGWLRPK